jgi:hypothetical protein
MTGENKQPEALVTAEQVAALEAAVLLEMLPTEADFLAQYGDKVVQKGTMTLTLNKLVAAEAMFCPVDPADRVDPVVRLRYLAQTAGASALLPEDRWMTLIPEQPKQKET